MIYQGHKVRCASSGIDHLDLMYSSMPCRSLLLIHISVHKIQIALASRLGVAWRKLQCSASLLLIDVGKGELHAEALPAERSSVQQASEAREIRNEVPLQVVTLILLLS